MLSMFWQLPAYCGNNITHGVGDCLATVVVFIGLLQISSWSTWRTYLIIFIWEDSTSENRISVYSGLRIGENLRVMVQYDGVTHHPDLVGWGFSSGVLLMSPAGPTISEVQVSMMAVMVTLSGDSREALCNFALLNSDAFLSSCPAIQVISPL